MNGSTVSERVIGIDLEQAEQLQATASSVLVPMRVTAPRHAPFLASVESATAGSVIVARISATSHVVKRNGRSITSADRDLLMLTLHRRGPAAIAQDDRQHWVKAGDLVVFDTARPFALDVSDTCDVVVVGLPRSMLGAHAELVSRRTATPLASDAGTRAVIAAFLSGLGDHVDELPGPSGVHLGDALSSLVITAFTEATAERADTATGLADRIIAYAMANLDDPHLSVESVARRHGISPRRLHQLFQHRERTFAAWVRYERLRRIRRDLLDPALSHRTIAAIAARWGVLDPSHVSRALKAVFGQSATEIRAGAVCRE